MRAATPLCFLLFGSGLVSLVSGPPVPQAGISGRPAGRFSSEEGSTYYPQDDDGVPSVEAAFGVYGRDGNVVYRLPGSSSAEVPFWDDDDDDYADADADYALDEEDEDEDDVVTDDVEYYYPVPTIRPGSNMRPRPIPSFVTSSGEDAAASAAYGRIGNILPQMGVADEVPVEKRNEHIPYDGPPPIPLLNVTEKIEDYKPHAGVLPFDSSSPLSDVAMMLSQIGSISFTPLSNVPAEVHQLKDGAQGAGRGSYEPPLFVGQGTDLQNVRSYPPLGDGAKPSPPQNMFVYCYPFTEDEITEKCASAKDQDAVGVYIPMVRDLGEAFLPDGFDLRQSDSWYEKIGSMKKNSSLLVFGVAYGKPDWKLISGVLADHPYLFDGVLLEWIGTGACISNIPEPTEEELAAIRKYTTRNEVRYFYRSQDRPSCKVPHPEFVDFQGRREGRGHQQIDAPSFIKPIFACFGGQEGRCYKAFNKFPELACDETLQRFAFNPYETVGGRMMHLVNETCDGLPRNLDYYGVV